MKHFAIAALMACLTSALELSAERKYYKPLSGQTRSFGRVGPRRFVGDAIYGHCRLHRAKNDVAEEQRGMTGVVLAHQEVIDEAGTLGPTKIHSVVNRLKTDSLLVPFEEDLTLSLVTNGLDEITCTIDEDD